MKKLKLRQGIVVLFAVVGLATITTGCGSAEEDNVVNTGGTANPGGVNQPGGPGGPGFSSFFLCSAYGAPPNAIISEGIFGGNDVWTEPRYTGMFVNSGQTLRYVGGPAQWKHSIFSGNDLGEPVTLVIWVGFPPLDIVYLPPGGSIAVNASGPVYVSLDISNAEGSEMACQNASVTKS